MRVLTRGSVSKVKLMKVGSTGLDWIRTCSKIYGVWIMHPASSAFRFPKSHQINLLRVVFSCSLCFNSDAFLSQCDELVEHGASVGQTPAAVVKKCKYTIAMLSDPSAALSVGNEYFGFDFRLSFCILITIVCPVTARWFLTKTAFLRRSVPEKVT